VVHLQLRDGLQGRARHQGHEAVKLKDTLHAERLAAEIIQAFQVTGLHPRAGAYFTNDLGQEATRRNATCACAVGAIAYVEKVTPPSAFDRRVNGIPAKHVECVTRGFDGTMNDNMYEHSNCGAKSDFDDLCPYYQAGVIAAHAMEEGDDD
jgi:hypothetical protein